MQSVIRSSITASGVCGYVMQRRKRGRIKNPLSERPTYTSERRQIGAFANVLSSLISCGHAGQNDATYVVVSIIPAA